MNDMKHRVYEWRIRAYEEDGKWEITVVDENGNPDKNYLTTEKMGPKLKELVVQEYIGISLTDSRDSGWIHCRCKWFPR